MLNWDDYIRSEFDILKDHIFNFLFYFLVWRNRSIRKIYHVFLCFFRDNKSKNHEIYFHNILKFIVEKYFLKLSEKINRTKESNKLLSM